MAMWTGLGRKSRIRVTSVGLASFWSAQAPAAWGGAGPGPAPPSAPPPPPPPPPPATAGARPASSATRRSRVLPCARRHAHLDSPTESSLSENIACQRNHRLSARLDETGIIPIWYVPAPPGSVVCEERWMKQRRLRRVGG